MRSRAAARDATLSLRMSDEIWRWLFAPCAAGFVTRGKPTPRVGADQDDRLSAGAGGLCWLAR
jgi:hypothetical protein